MTENPWTERFHGLLEPDVLRRRVTVEATPLVGLEYLPVEVAKASLADGMRKIYVPSEQALDLMRMLVERALAHSVVRYPSAGTYLRGVYAEEPPVEPSFAVCITGLAGVGKTQMVKALCRTLGAARSIDVDPHHRGVLMLQSMYLEQKAKTGLSPMLTRLCSQLGLAVDVKVKTIDDLVASCQRRAYNSGVPLLFYDEVQLRSLGSAANALVTQDLLTLRELGVVLVPILNYSLLHRLKKRPAEDRQRLLSDVHVLTPPSPDSASYRHMLMQYREVSPTAFGFDVEVHAERIHCLTAGLPRLMILLLTIAYGVAREDRRTAIGLVHLEKAFRSIEYSQNREDVDIITRHAVNPRVIARSNGRLRDDLSCPFHEIRPDAKAAEEAQRKRDEEIATRLVVSSLARSERERLKALENESGAVVLPPPPRPKRSPVRRPTTGAELLSNAEALRRSYRLGSSD